MKPEWDLTRNWFYVIPGETVKHVDRIPDAIRNVKFRHDKMDPSVPFACGQRLFDGASCQK